MEATQSLTSAPSKKRKLEKSEDDDRPEDPEGLGKASSSSSSSSASPSPVPEEAASGGMFPRRSCSPSLIKELLHEEQEVKVGEDDGKVDDHDPQKLLAELVKLVHKNDFETKPKMINDDSLKLDPPMFVPASPTPQSKKKKRTVLGSGLVGIHHQRALGVFVSPLHRPKVEDSWSPREIAIFESAICAYGKRFHSIAKAIPHKSTQDVVNFYYVWKKSPSYKAWKSSFYADNKVSAP